MGGNIKGPVRRSSSVHPADVSEKRVTTLCNGEGYFFKSGAIGDLTVFHPVVPPHIKDASLTLHVACLKPVSILLK